MAASSCKSLAGGLQPLHEIGGAGEQHATAVLDEGAADGRRADGSCRRRAARNSSKLAALSSQASPAASAMTLRLAEHRHGGEVEVVEGLAGRQTGFGEVALDAPPAAFGDLDARRGRRGSGPPASPPCRRARQNSGQSRAMAGRRSSLQQQRQAGGVDLDRSLMAAATPAARRARRRRRSPRAA